MPYADPKKRREAWRRWYARHQKQQIARVKRRSLKLRTEVREYKESKPCADCKRFYPYYVMDFDHVRGKKKNNVADIVKRSHSRAAAQAEIAKCDLVCSNCHRERTHQRRTHSQKKTRRK